VQVFAAAKVAAPSVVLIEEVEKIFIGDKMRAAALAPPGGEPPCRVRRQLAAEVAALTPADGILVLCTSAEPQACVLGDEAALQGFAQLLVPLPLPSERSRRRLLAAFAAGARASWGAGDVDSVAALCTAAHLSEGYTPGQLRLAVEKAAAGARQAATGAKPQPGAGSLLPRFLEALQATPPESAEDVRVKREWRGRAHAARHPAPASAGKQQGKAAAKERKG
jgi:SpoVK/Ycf46/Vps4 family AAA+-type ATPase